jgi:hypothetical protein
MSCCGKDLHQECVAQWRRSVATMRHKVAPGRQELRSPDTTLCPCCKAVLSGGATSARRMFSNERPV